MADVDSPFAQPSSDDDAETGRRRPFRRAKHRQEGDEERKKGSFWKELPILIITALVLTFLIQTFLARVYVIPSQSMEQTLHGCTGCTNDRVLVDKLSYRFTDPSPGDVVVFKGPESWGVNPELMGTEPSSALARGLRQLGSLVGLASPDERDFVKRVIAVGGQTVQCCDEEKRVLVDGKALDEPYLYFENGRGVAQDDFALVQVPAGHLWVMGDNRNNSSDSRRHVDDSTSGTIPVDNVIGKARFIVLPPARWGGIDDHDPQAGALGTLGSLSATPLHAWAPLAFGLMLAWPVRLGASAAGSGLGGLYRRCPWRRR
ncbi:MAG TPA: signal peptidase I [Pseudonocardiaceae bacterium]